MYIGTGPPHPLAGSVERPRGGAHRHNAASGVSSSYRILILPKNMDHTYFEYNHIGHTHL